MKNIKSRVCLWHSGFAQAYCARKGAIAAPNPIYQIKTRLRGAFFVRLVSSYLTPSVETQNEMHPSAFFDAITHIFMTSLLERLIIK
jgi:hypothetical protein